MASDPVSRKTFLKLAGLTSGASLLGGKSLLAGPSPVSDSLHEPPPGSTLSSSVTVQSRFRQGELPLILDANVGLGRFSYGLNSDLAETTQTLGHLQKNQIQQALTYSVLARQTDPEEGNAIVLEEARTHNEILPVSVLTPFAMDLDAEIERMNQHDIRVARLFPESGHFSVQPSVIGPLVETLQRHRKTLFIDFESLDWSGRAIDYDAVYQLCRTFPDGPIVLIGSTILGSRNYPNLMKECPNLYLEISQIFQPGGISGLVEQGYGKRLIFGSAFPEREPGALLNMLAHADLTPRQMADICSGNLLRLLGESVKDRSVSIEYPSSKGVIDMHVHQGTYQSAIGMETPEMTIKHMDRCGVDVVVATSLWSCFGEVKRGNRAVCEGGEAFPGRYFGYLTLDPKYPDEVQQQIDLYGNHPSFRGIKLHLMLHGLTIDDPRNNLIYKFADRQGWPLLIHGDGTIEAWEQLCGAYPNAHFIKAHIGGSDPKFNEETTEFAQAARRQKNLYLDCGYSRTFPGALDRLAAICGAEKLLFGSDYPMFDFAFEAGRIVSSNLREEQKQLILQGNARRLLRL